MAAAELKERVVGTFLINCAGGMNAKGARQRPPGPRSPPPLFHNDARS